MFIKLNTRFFIFVIFLLCQAITYSQNKIGILQQNSRSSNISGQILTPITKPSALPTPRASSPDEKAGLKVKLYYLREATKIATILNAFFSEQKRKVENYKRFVGAELTSIR